MELKMKKKSSKIPAPNKKIRTTPRRRVTTPSQRNLLNVWAPAASSLLLMALLLALLYTPVERMFQIEWGQDGFQKLPLAFQVEGVAVPWGYAGWVTQPTRPKSVAPVLDRNMDGGKLEVDGISFGHGIGTHAPSQIALSLDGKFRRFSCQVGLDQASDQSRGVVYSLRADGREIYRSSKIYYGAGPLPIQADVAGVKQLVLCADITDVEDLASAVDWTQLHFEK